MRSHVFLKHGTQANFFCKTLWPFPYGPVLSGDVGPKSAMTLQPVDEAMCMGPVSVVISVLDFE